MSESTGGLGGNTTTTTELREPLALYQYDPNGSAVACVANAMHMLGYDGPFNDPEYIHQQTDRMYGSLEFSNNLFLWMLKNGVHIDFINPFDFEEYKARGVDYLIEQYPSNVVDEEEFRAFFTDDYVKARIAERKESEAAMEEVGGYTDTKKEPSIEDVERSLSAGNVVVQLYLDAGKINTYPVLAYKVDDEGMVGIYAPIMEGQEEFLPLLGTYSYDEIAQYMDTKQGIEVFTRA